MMTLAYFAFCCCAKINQNILGGGEDLFGLYILIIVQELKQGRHLEARAAAEATEGTAYWPALSQHPRPAAHHGLDPPTSVTNQENDLQTCLQANRWRRFLRVLR